MGTFTNSEDLNEMRHDAAFHQSTLFVKVKKDLQTKECNIFSLNIFYFNLVRYTYIQIYTIKLQQNCFNIIPDTPR